MDKNELKNLEELKNITMELKDINKALRPEKKIDWNIALMQAIVLFGVVVAIWVMYKILINSIQ